MEHALIIKLYVIGFPSSNEKGLSLPNLYNVTPVYRKLCNLQLN